VNLLSLFSGVGGLELGLERAGMTVVGQVEIDPFCRQVLAKHWPEVPRHDDVRTAEVAVEALVAVRPRPTVDVVCGGFPCQDISNAGQAIGITGARSGLWSAMAGHRSRTTTPIRRHGERRSNPCSRT
jgi:DNA (cytosine-5)-methyltransferase 1